MTPLAALRGETIRGRLVALEPYAPAHGERIVALRNQPEARYNLNQAEPSTAESQSRWTGEYLARDNDLFWVITAKGGVVGCTGLYAIDLAAGTAEKGRLVLDAGDRQAAPYALEAELLLVRFAFDRVGLRTLVTSVRHDNMKMQSMNRRLGFREAGRKPIRGVEYTLATLERAAFDPARLEGVVAHWSARGA